MINTDNRNETYADNSNEIYADENMDGNADLLYGDLTYKIRGAIFEVYNNLGFGHKEQVYQKALTHEFETRQIPFQRELTLKVNYKGDIIGKYRPDFVIDGKIIVELKAVEFMPKTYETQLINYLKATGFQLGLLANFGREKLYIKRLVLTDQRNNLRKSELNRRESLI